MACGRRQVSSAVVRSETMLRMIAVLLVGGLVPDLASAGGPQQAILAPNRSVLDVAEVLSGILTNIQTHLEAIRESQLELQRKQDGLTERMATLERRLTASAGVDITGEVSSSGGPRRRCGPPSPAASSRWPTRRPAATPRATEEQRGCQTAPAAGCSDCRVTVTPTAPSSACPLRPCAAPAAGAPAAPATGRCRTPCAGLTPRSEPGANTTPTARSDELVGLRVCVWGGVFVWFCLSLW